MNGSDLASGLIRKFVRDLLIFALLCVLLGSIIGAFAFWLVAA